MGLFDFGEDDLPTGEDDLYNSRDPRNHIHEGEPRALYWYAYRQMYDCLKEGLVPGQEVPDGLEIMLVENNSLRAEDFDLRRKDRGPLGAVFVPGKSAHICFTYNLHEACGAIFDRNSKRQDRLYRANTAGINDANFVVIHCPTPNLPLHVRIVHSDHLLDSSLETTPHRDRQMLARLFSQGKIR